VDFVVVGLNHRTAPVEVREKAYIPEPALRECLQRVVDRELLQSGLLLSTCNRTELYGFSNASDGGQRLLDSFGLWPHQLSFEAWRQHAFSISGDQGLVHLYRVAAGLDSMVVGEAQVLGQLKDAARRAGELGMFDSQLHIVVRGALRAGKRVRSETELGRSPVSVSHAAVVLARQIFDGNLAGRRVLILGAGAMSEVALRLLKNQGIASVTVASRSLERAEAVGLERGADAIAFSEVEASLVDADIVISSSSAPHYLLDTQTIERVQALRDGRPLILLDIAVPRDIDPQAGSIEGVHLFNIDDLRSVAERSLARRRSWVDAAERIVAEEVDRTRNSLSARSRADAVATMVKRAEIVRDRELVRFTARLPEEDRPGREALGDLAHDLTAKLLHEFIEDLHDQATQ
jgi:glutamyl-tRNA reductase